MKNIPIILLLVLNISFAQTDDRFQRNFQLEEDFEIENLIGSYNSFDFSPIWTQTENSSIFGIIGDDHQRIKIKLISVIKNPDKPSEYLITGKSNVKGNICDFNGIIRIVKVQEVKKMHFGVDEIYKDKQLKSQGILIAEYDFSEKKEQQHSGIFKGKLYSKWYLDSTDKIKYDNIEQFSNSYMNNAFIGIWKMYNSNLTKKCNWADFRVPKSNQDFDIGAGEFSPSERYYDKGWKNYSQAFVYGNKQAREEEFKKWWK